MRVSRRLFAVAAALLVSVMAFAQGQKIITPVQILDAKDMPHPEYFLPDPPDTTSALFFSDYVKYQEGRAIRGTERGAQAVRDANTSLSYYMARFGEAMGKELSPEAYPTLATYMITAYTTVRKSIQGAKDKYKRRRPYEQFHEASAVPEEEQKNDLTSYPSGHSVRAWTIAMALVAIDPAHQDEILKTGYELCRSRVIVGFHYQTDIEAAMLAASAGYARLCCEPAFQLLQMDARKEFNEKQ